MYPALQVEVCHHREEAILGGQELPTPAIGHISFKPNDTTTRMMLVYFVRLRKLSKNVRQF